MLLSDGDTLTYHVTNVAAGLNPGDPYSLTLDTPLDRAVLVSEIELFGKLLFCRLDVDDLKLSYITSDKATASLDFIELLKEYPA